MELFQYYLQENRVMNLIKENLIRKEDKENIFCYGTRQSITTLCLRTLKHYEGSEYHSLSRKYWCVFCF